MLNWNESYNWTKEQFTSVLDKAEINRRETLGLDTEHCSYQNEQEIVMWARGS